MKRIVLTVLGILLMAGVAGWAVGRAVVPNAALPPGLPPSSWACYQTCVLPTDIVAADFNQDGWLDLAVSCSATGNVFYYQNAILPRGAFAQTLTPPVNIGTPGGFPNAQFLVAGHINGYNGFPDLAIVYAPTVAGALTSIAAANNAGAPFAGVGALALGGGTIIDITGGNFTNNNVMDFAYLTAGGLDVWAWNGVTYVNISGGTLPMPNAPIALAAADFDQDGWEDVAVVTNGPNLYVFFNARGGSFAAARRLGPIPVAIPIPTAIGTGDFDADGFPDLVVVGNRPPATPGEQPNGLAQAFINQVHQAVGGFGPLAAMRTWGFNAKAVEVFDADGNGRDDFAVANWGSKTVTVFLADAAARLVNDTRGTRDQCLNPAGMNPDRLQVWFQLFKIELRCGYYPIALASGDFDHNGKMDLAVALQSADEELCAQNESCIEVDYDIACGFVAARGGVAGQISHSGLPTGGTQELQKCPNCKEPCAENVPPKVEIQTESGTKNQ